MKYSTRTLGLKSKLHMLSIYIPFTKQQTGILFAWRRNIGLAIDLFNKNVFRQVYPWLEKR